MARLIAGLEVHRYAPELNKLHLRNHQVTITVSHPDNINLSRLYRGQLTSLTDLPEHLTRLRQRHNVPSTRINIELRYR